MRQDPDAILIGEIRDLETAKIATEAALTGHIVFATLHTNSAPAGDHPPDRDRGRALHGRPLGHRRAGPAARGADLRELQGGLHAHPGGPLEVLQGGGPDRRHLLPRQGLPQVPQHGLQGPRGDPRARPHHRGDPRPHLRGAQRPGDHQGGRQGRLQAAALRRPEEGPPRA